MLFLLLVIVAFAVTGESPGSDDPTAEVVEYWTDGFFALLAAIAWVAAVGLILFRRSEGPGPPVVASGET